MVERFFGSLKHDWILKAPQPTREHMKADVAAYMRYYNVERLHSANNEVSPVNFEMKVFQAEFCARYRVRMPEPMTA